MNEPIATLIEEPSIQDDEAALVRAAQENPAHFKKRYLRWVKSVYQYLFFQVRSTAEAEDLTSQVFMKACELILSLPDGEKDLIRLRYVARLTYQEIEIVTGRSEEASR